MNEIKKRIGYTYATFGLANAESQHRQVMTKTYWTTRRVLNRWEVYQPCQS